jgi:flagellar biosynthesis GTPase FlhF
MNIMLKKISSEESYWEERKNKQQNDRQMRERKRTEELQKLKAMELTAEHTKKEKEELKKRKDLQTTAEKNSKKRKEARMDEQPKEKGEMGEAQRKKQEKKKAMGPKKGVAKKKAKEPPEKQGNRRKPNPCDGHGCDHVGVLELKGSPRAYLKLYVKEGGCLFQMPCYDCRKKVDRKEVGKEGTVRVLDLADLLTGKKGNNDEMTRYCNYGVASHNMQEDDEWKTCFACDMVLCIPCYKECLDGSGHGASRNEQRSRPSRK